jgi:hypothetical protein
MNYDERDIGADQRENTSCCEMNTQLEELLLLAKEIQRLNTDGHSESS